VNDLTLRLNPNIVDWIALAINNNKPVDIQIDEEASKYLYRLDGFVFDYFTHVEVHKSNQENYYELWLRKCYPNYSNFMFYEEHDSVIRELHKYFNLNLEVEKMIDEFKKGKDVHQFDFLIEGRGIGRLSGTGRDFVLCLNFPFVA